MLITKLNAVKYYIFYKPFGVLCQFSKQGNKKTLAEFGPFPKDVYPAGRLDVNSEGLVLLTNDGNLKYFLLEPKFKHPRIYLVQVERIPTMEDLERLRQGVLIDKRKTLPAKVKLSTNEPNLPPRSKPIRLRKSVPTGWLEITLDEGRNRQVRKMTAAIGHPTLRLIRIKIGPISLEGLMPGESRQLSSEEVEQLKLITKVTLQR